MPPQMRRPSDYYGEVYSERRARLNSYFTPGFVTQVIGLESEDVPAFNLTREEHEVMVRIVTSFIAETTMPVELVRPLYTICSLIGQVIDFEKIDEVLFNMLLNHSIGEVMDVVGEPSVLIAYVYSTFDGFVTLRPALLEYLRACERRDERVFSNVVRVQSRRSPYSLTYEGILKNKVVIDYSVLYIKAVHSNIDYPRAVLSAKPLLTTSYLSMITSQAISSFVSHHSTSVMLRRSVHTLQRKHDFHRRVCVIIPSGEGKRQLLGLSSAIVNHTDLLDTGQLTYYYNNSKAEVGLDHILELNRYTREALIGSPEAAMIVSSFPYAFLDDCGNCVIPVVGVFFLRVPTGIGFNHASRSSIELTFGDRIDFFNDDFDRRSRILALLDKLSWEVNHDTTRCLACGRKVVDH